MLHFFAIFEWQHHLIPQTLYYERCWLFDGYERTQAFGPTDRVFDYYCYHSHQIGFEFATIYNLTVGAGLLRCCNRLLSRASRGTEKTGVVQPVSKKHIGSIVLTCLV